MNKPQEKLDENVTLCHKCDIWQTDYSKITEKKFNKTTKSGVETNHPNEAGHITTLQISSIQVKEKAKNNSTIEQKKKQDKHNQEVNELTAKQIERELMKQTFRIKTKLN